MASKAPPTATAGTCASLAITYRVFLPVLLKPDAINAGKEDIHQVFGFRLTVVRYDGPGHGRCVDLADHPEHAQPAEVLASLLPGQHFSKEGENDGHGTSYSAESTRKVQMRESFSCLVDILHFTAFSKDILKEKMTTNEFVFIFTSVIFVRWLFFSP